MEKGVGGNSGAVGRQVQWGEVGSGIELQAMGKMLVFQRVSTASFSLAGVAPVATRRGFRATDREVTAKRPRQPRRNRGFPKSFVFVEKKCCII